MLECTGNKIYTGASNNPKQRIKHHYQRCGARFTLLNPPLAVIAIYRTANQREALQLESKIKQLSRAQKILLGKQWRKQSVLDEIWQEITATFKHIH